MPIYDIYSRRKRRSEQTEPDVYRYDIIPSELRMQIKHIWHDAIGPYDITAGGDNRKTWGFIRDAVCRETGRETLMGRENTREDCFRYLLGQLDVDNWLDLVEFGFRYIQRVLAQRTEHERDRCGIIQDPDDAITELNFRFREASVGYQFEDGQIFRVDSELLHAEVVRPALHLLSDPRFAGPEQEFLSAHAHYRVGEYKDCITDALNAFESTMKAICDIKGWEYNKGARASDLLKVLRANDLLPDYLDNSFDQLAATLFSGLPKVRNEEGGHGQGAQPKSTPAYIAAYALHLAAAKIVLLVDAMQAGE